MRKVFCLINGEGEIVQEDDNKIVVDFGHDNMVSYNKDGHLIYDEENGKVSFKRTLFDKEPKIVTDNAMLDDAGKVVEDMDVIIYGSKSKFVWRAGFYDAKNMSIFTTDGKRNKNSLFRNINSDEFILKIDSTKEIDVLREHLNADEESESFEEPDTLTEELIDFGPVVQEEPMEDTDTSVVDDNTPVELNKEAEVVEEPTKVKESAEAKEEPVEELLMSIKDGSVYSKFRQARTIENNLIALPAADKKVVVNFEKIVDGAELYASISFFPEKVLNIVKNNNEKLLRDYVNLFDSFIKLNGTQKNLSSENVYYYIEDGKFFLEFK